MTSLYLCYQSIAEPLTQTQVVAYLEGLAGAGYRMLLVTFEPRPLGRLAEAEWRARLAAKGIEWSWLRYHKWPSVPATAWDMLAGVAWGLGLVRRHRVGLVHARGHVAGVMGLALKRLAGVKLLFDVRGFLAEEYVDAGVWPAGGWLYRSTKRMERRLVGAADGIVVLTQAARRLLERWYAEEIAGKAIQVIPCCVDLRKYAAAAARRTGEGPAPPTRLYYVGKLGGCYPVQRILEFFSLARERLPGLQLSVFTQTEAGRWPSQLGAPGTVGGVEVAFTEPDELPAKLSEADFGICFYADGTSNAGRSPTKASEYLAAGVPIICNAGVGDLAELIGSHAGTGVIIAELQSPALAKGVDDMLGMRQREESRQACRRLARAHFDLVSVGWERYRSLYQRMWREAVA